MSEVWKLHELIIEWAQGGRRDFGGERISHGIYTIVKQMQFWFRAQRLQFQDFRIDELLAYLQRVANRQSLDLRVDHPASRASAPVAVASVRSPNKRPSESDSPHGPSPAKRSKRDAPPRSPTPPDVEPSSDVEVTPPQAVSATVSPSPSPRQHQQQQQQQQQQPQQQQQQQYPRYPVRSTRGRAPDRRIESFRADWGANGSATSVVNRRILGNQPLSRLLRVKTCDHCDCELTASSTSARRPELCMLCGSYRARYVSLMFPWYFSLLVLVRII